MMENWAIEGIVNSELRGGEPRGCFFISACRLLPPAVYHRPSAAWRQLASKMNTGNVSENRGAEMCEKGVILGGFLAE
jgi:hypothetical protein